ncbi:flavohemoglobin expression-modulating QEGLA motif protein [Endozoicomonas lisbonensis]|uniref:Uncharacterized protein (TIGR02421 family) n=1 Tax=Endozoicomonas lisbonensis TaxID=3120522 RepID=A0ABV2SB73_9GAMM
MLTLSEQQIIQHIQSGESFEATLPDKSLVIKVLEFVPFVGTAIHHGNRFREGLNSLCALSEKERYYEEDPGSGNWLDGLPITLVACDSRYEYDLNRSPEDCLYDEAWGKKIWHRPLPDEERQISLAKHARYYRILGALLEKLASLFGRCLLFDLHSYNWQRDGREDAPVFNIGTAQIDRRRWHKTLKSLNEALNEIELPNLSVSAENDAVFYGRGYQATFTRENFRSVLTVPLEVKKIYMDETTGEFFPLVHEALREQLSRALFNTAVSFASRIKKKSLKRTDLAPSDIEPVVLEVDRKLYRLVRQMDTLMYINPVNLLQEKKRFFSRGYHYTPNFRYRQLRLDPYSVKEQLYRLPVSAISDPSLRELYRRVVDSHAMKAELLTTIGTEQFLYNSLRYYGEPSVNDQANAQFLLHAPLLDEERSVAKDIYAEQAIDRFQQAAKELELTCQVRSSKRLVAKAMVDNQKQTLLVNDNIKVSERELQALIHHELGVHMVTTLNARDQTLNVFRLGLPGNTHAQEGLAILCEYLSGNLTVSRLHTLAIRVIAVSGMLKGWTFGYTCRQLEDQYGLSRDSAFTTTARIFRGGGFTKDYVYLSGLRDLLDIYKEADLSGLLIGKGSLFCLPLVNDLLERGIIEKATRTPPALNMGIQHNPVLSFLVKGLK